MYGMSTPALYMLQFSYSFDKERKVIYGDDKSHSLNIQSHSLTLPVNEDKPQSPRHQRKHKSKSRSAKKADKQDPVS
jgi:hypothetical protein